MLSRAGLELWEGVASRHRGRGCGTKIPKKAKSMVEAQERHPPNLKSTLSSPDRCLRCPLTKLHLIPSWLHTKGQKIPSSQSWVNLHRVVLLSEVNFCRGHKQPV